MNNSIRKRKYYAVEIMLCSPLNVSGGTNEFTDSDVLINGDGEAFVPGTSLAGAMRGYLGLDKKKKGIMGFSDGEDGKMSSIFISDLYFDTRPVISVRDGIKLSDRKNVRNKFDMEIIEPGACGVLYLNYVVRQSDQEADYEKGIGNVLQAVQNGTIRIGANKNRGFGRLTVRNIYEREFEYREKGRDFDLKGWLAFKKNARDLSLYSEKKDYQEWIKEKEKAPEPFVKITVPLKLTGGISIRRYSTKPEEADFEHITCQGVPVIPGTSWNGAIRADARNILLSLQKTEEEAARIMETWFGKVSEKDKTAEQSAVVIGESKIDGAISIPMTRNRIDRFTSSTRDGALYSEISWFGGKTELEIMVRKDEAKAYYALIGILNLVIADIQDGYVPVGGQVSVGRGIFSANEEKHVQYSEPVCMETCMAELYSL